MCHHRRDCGQIPGGRRKERDLDYCDEGGYLCKFCTGMEGRGEVVEGGGDDLPPSEKGKKDKGADDDGEGDEDFAPDGGGDGIRGGVKPTISRSQKVEPEVTQAHQNAPTQRSKPTHPKPPLPSPTTSLWKTRERKAKTKREQETNASIAKKEAKTQTSEAAVVSSKYHFMKYKESYGKGLPEEVDQEVWRRKRKRVDFVANFGALRR